MSHLMNTYARLPVAFSYGEGSWVYRYRRKDLSRRAVGDRGRQLGHNHPDLVAAISAQAGRLLHTSNLYRMPQQEQLADKLAELSGMQEVFLQNSGCEANEAAIKLARFYGHQRGIENPSIVVMEKSFHGRTMATLSATGNHKVQKGFRPLVSGFIRVPFNDLSAVRSLIGHHPSIVAVLVEVVQGEGGGFTWRARTICADCVRCAANRTG